jgi:hypothetical protein
MNPEIAVVVLVGLGVVAFALSLYRRILSADESELEQGHTTASPLPYDSIAPQLKLIDQSRRILLGMIAVAGFGTILAYILEATRH